MIRKRSFTCLSPRIASIAPTKICIRCNVTHLIHYLLPKIGRRLAPEVVYRIRVRIEAGEEVPAIAKAIDVSRPTVYKIQLNLDLYDEPYALASLIQGRLRLLLAHQELMSLILLGVKFLLTRYW